MGFIYNNIGQIPEKVGPKCMIVEDRNMQHIGIREDNSCGAPNGRAFILVRIAIVCGMWHPAE
jgi:hypothetical protein